MDENLFLALLLDPALHETVTRRVGLSARKYGFTGRPMAAERMHISLLNFSPYREYVATKVSTIAATVRFPPFEITLDTAMSFLISGRDRQPFVLTGERCVESVRAFHRPLHDWFFGDDITREKAPRITPHMTLLRDRQVIPRHAVERSLSWTVRDFVLVRSYVGESRYDIVGRWPLIPDEGIIADR